MEEKKMKMDLIFLILFALGNGVLSVLFFMQGRMIDAVILAFASFLATGGILYIIYKLLWTMEEMREMKIRLIFAGIIALGDGAFSVLFFMQGAMINGTIFAFASFLATGGFLYIFHKLLRKKERIA